MANALALALRIEPGEGRPLAYLLVHSFFVGIALVSFYAASSALFLTNYGAGVLPYVYIASAVVSTSLGWVYSRLEKRWALPRLLAGTLFFLFLSVTILRIIQGATAASWPSFALLAWFPLVNALASVVLWDLAGRIFDVRQGKRLYGLISGGKLLASLGGGDSRRRSWSLR